jgi:hypothetical protein
VLSNVSELAEAGNEFVSHNFDSRTWMQSLGRSFIGTMSIGYGKIDFFNLRNLYRDLRFFPIVSDVPYSDGNIWYFRLGIVNPRASELYRWVNAQYRKRIDGFLHCCKISMKKPSPQVKKPSTVSYKQFKMTSLYDSCSEMSM